MDKGTLISITKVIQDFVVESDGTIDELNVANHRLREVTQDPDTLELIYSVLTAIHGERAARPDMAKYVHVDVHQSALTEEKTRANMAISNGLASYQKDELKMRNLETQVQTLQAFAQSVKQFEDLRKSIADQAGRLIG